MKTALLFSIIALTAASLNGSFLEDQKKFSRVRTALAEKKDAIIKILSEAGLHHNELQILITVFKQEKQLDIYAKNKNDLEYKKVVSYEICQSSGELGPKRKEGDGQVPEGFYFIERFNPVSNFHLSLGINYPNEADRKIGTGRLGGDIFIHGNCVTIGCVPMTDEIIKEIYLYALFAKNNGQEKIKAYFFPFRMNDENMAKYKEKYKADTSLIEFWQNLKAGYDKFVKDKRELKITVDSKGKYVIN